ncbi:hypothetical protein LSAT2_033081 [Lamellibrachia satsuma]|nr:hypothetical protein LSAT2_033081 [Lamellibrachia satsuma]
MATDADLPPVVQGCPTSKTGLVVCLVIYAIQLDEIEACRPPGKACGIYNPRTHMCCHGVIQLREFNDACCETRGYYSNGYICCNSVVQLKGLTTRCCDTKSYNYKRFFCCNNNIYPIGVNGLRQTEARLLQQRHSADQPAVLQKILIPQADLL